MTKGRLTCGEVGGPACRRFACFWSFKQAVGKFRPARRRWGGGAATANIIAGTRRWRRMRRFYAATI
jgi:hypothetical protein